MAAITTEDDVGGSLGLWMGTWNVHGRGPPAIDDLVKRPKSMLTRGIACRQYMYVIALQELNELGPWNSVGITTFEPSERAAPWIRAVQCALEADCASTISRVAYIECGMQALAVFVASSAQVVGIGSKSMSLGFLGGALVNKAALAIRLEVQGTTFCFCNVHLDAYRGIVHQQARKRQLDQVMKTLAFDRPVTNTNSNTMHILDHDVAVLMGDFNSRLLDSAYEYQHIIELIREERWDQLIAMDELANKREHILAEFLESRITFPPTYKYDVGTVSTFDTSEKARWPAYCDRILCRAPGISNFLDYRSYQSFVISDHKPVTCWMIIQLNKQSSPSEPVSWPREDIIHRLVGDAATASKFIASRAWNAAMSFMDSKAQK